MSASPRPVAAPAPAVAPDDAAATAARTSKASLVAEVARLRALVDAREATLKEREAALAERTAQVATQELSIKALMNDVFELREAAALVPKAPKFELPPDQTPRIRQLEAEVAALKQAHAAELAKKEARIKQLLDALGVK